MRLGFLQMTRKLEWVSLLACLLTLGCGPEGSAVEIGADKESALRAREVEVTSVVRRDFNRTLESTGSLIPRDRARLRALIEGPLEAVFVEIGDPVQRGQALFKTRPVDSRLAVESAEAALRTSRASLNELLAWRRPEEIDVLRAEGVRSGAEH